VKSLLIVNPAAGSDRGAELAGTLQRRLSERFGDVAIVLTAGEGDARDAAREAAHRAVDHLFVAGGDGTLNEALNGVCEVAHGLEAVTFGVVPLGTGNDFATALGIPEDLDAALEVLGADRGRSVDVGVMNGHHFINVSAGGFIAEVSEAVSSPLKTIAGKLAYLIGGAQVLMRHEPVYARYCVGGATRTLAIETFAVCNSRLVGGGRLIAPDAVLDDGELDVCLIEDMSNVEFVGLLRRVSNGEHLADERVHYFRASTLDIEFERRVKVNVDGQVVETDRCRYAVLPRAARFLANPASRLAAD
jgi:diacylglycerol kinase (ATP)